MWILHKALEASQLEKRTCAEFLAEKSEQERLELLRHREREAADLRGRLEEVKKEAESMRRRLNQRDAQLLELQDNIGMLIEKNTAKQEVRSHLRTDVEYHLWTGNSKMIKSSFSVNSLKSCSEIRSTNSLCWLPVR